MSEVYTSITSPLNCGNERVVKKTNKLIDKEINRD